jgi:UDPglucose 6-dehydrogenase
MKIAIIGTGYVGLVSGTCFADMGHDVCCVDIVQSKVDGLNRGEIPIYEPGLDHLVSRNVKENRLSFTTDLVSAVNAAQAIFIAVGTPQGNDGSADLKYVIAVAQSIGEAMKSYKVVITKSTVPVGTGEKVRVALAGKTKFDFDVVSNPEFLKEGAAIEDFMRPDRVVIGVESDRAKKVMEELYAPFVRNNHPILYMDIKSAEMTKYAANAMLATRISFMNAVANLCDVVGADVNQVRKGIGTDKRIGMSFLYPGIGYGGSCFPKDVQALIRTAEDFHVPFDILNAVEKVNQAQKVIMVEKIKTHFKSQVNGLTITLWGLAFKPETDDIREAPSLAIIDALLTLGVKIRVCDPEAIEPVKKIFQNKIEYFEHRYQALEGADALVLVTEWNEYRNPDFALIKKSLKKPVVFDGRNIYIDSIKSFGFSYYCIGANS